MGLERFLFSTAMKASKKGRTTSAPPVPPNGANIYGRIGHTPLLVALVALLVAAVVNYSQFDRYRKYSHLPKDLWPIQGTRLSELSEFVGERAKRMLWGTYRPGLYFGVRSKAPLSTLMGVMWTNPQGADPLGSLRHEAEQSHGMDTCFAYIYGDRRANRSMYGVVQV